MFFEAKVSFPLAGDLLNVDNFFGFYQDGNNYLGFDYIAVGAVSRWQAYCVTAGILETTDIGDLVVADQDYNLKIIFEDGLVSFILDETNLVQYNIVPSGLHELLINTATGDNNAKNIDLNFMKLLMNKI